MVRKMPENIVEKNIEVTNIRIIKKIIVIIRIMLEKIS